MLPPASFCPHFACARSLSTNALWPRVDVGARWSNWYMDLGTTTPASAAGDGRSTAQILAAVRDDTDVIDRREIDRLQNIVAWARRNTVDSVEAGAATIQDSYIDTGIPIAGEGAPLVSEFALMELSAT